MSRDNDLDRGMIMSVLTEEFSKFFHTADTDEDGYLSLKELTDCLRSRGYKGSDQEIRKYFNLADILGDHKISYAEYMMSMKDADMILHSTAAMRRVFNSFDLDGSGSIDKRELKEVFEAMGRVFSDEEIKAMMDVADTDGSGELEYEEFIDVMFKSHKKKGKK